VLRLADDLAACPETLVSEPRRRNADAVDVACRQPSRPRQPNIERVQVRALAAEIAGFEHRGNVADTAAACFRIAERVLDDPLVDAARLLEVAEGPAHDAVGRGFDDAVRRHEIGRGGIELPLVVRQRRHAGAPGEIDHAVPRRNPAHDFNGRCRLAVRPLDVQHLCPVFPVTLEHR